MTVWVLNLDADLELAARGGYQPSQRVSSLLDPVVPCAARQLLQPGERWLSGDEVLAGRWSGARGRAWCPTPNALARLRAAGAVPEPAPPASVLRRVNHRRFCLDLGGGAPGAWYVDDDDGLDELSERSRKQPWLCKRPHGFAGRGQRRLSHALSDDDRRWLAGATRKGGFLAEPWLELERELCLHGRIFADGRVELGALCEQRVDAHRAWQETTLADAALRDRHGRAFAEAAERVASALVDAGYFGPFGIDGYEFESAGKRRLNPLGEINARYSMGYRIGMGSSAAGAPAPASAPPVSSRS